MNLHEQWDTQCLLIKMKNEINLLWESNIKLHKPRFSMHQIFRGRPMENGSSVDEL